MTRDFITHINVSENEIAELLSEINTDDPSEASDFFARFGFAQMYRGNHFFETLKTGLDVLHLCARLNPEKYRSIHKGYPLYWMGMAAYRIYDFQSAIYYIDATLSEDIKNEPDNPDSPPRLFIRLEGEDDRQAAKHIVMGAQETIEEYITLYNELLEESNPEIPPLTIDDIRANFLSVAASSENPDVRSLASTFITFFLEFKYRDFQLRLRKEPGTNEPFFIHLFKGCLLFESLLKNNASIEVTGTTLAPVLNELTNELSLPEEFSIGGVTLSSVLDEVQTVDDRISFSIIMAGKLRNTIGHNMGWSSQLSNEQYINGFLHVGISCLHAINTLYREQ